MIHRVPRAVALALAALALPAALAAQARPMSAGVPGAANGLRAPAPAAGANAELRSLYAELQQISARLQSAHGRAMEDAGLRQTQDALMRDVKAAMQRTDPGLETLLQRVQAMEGEANAAQQRRDANRLQALNREFATIQQRFMRVQTTVMRQPGLAQRARTFEERLHARMVQVEPETDRLIERGKQIQERLMQAARASQPQQRQQAAPRGPVRSPE